MDEGLLDVLRFFVLGVLVVSLFVVVGIVWVKFSDPIVVKVEGLPSVSPLEGDVKDFLVLGERFAKNHRYNLSGYNCVNYSKDLKFLADELGFSTEYVEGCDFNFSVCHAWLRLVVDYEPISGKLVDYGLVYPNVRTDEELYWKGGR